MDESSEQCKKEIDRLISILNRQNDLIEGMAKEALKNNQDYERVLKISTPSFEHSTNLSNFDIYTALYAKIHGNIHYITLIFSDSDANRVSADFNCYESKIDMDECSAIIELKRTIRRMQKEPKTFFRLRY